MINNWKEFNENFNNWFNDILGDRTSVGELLDRIVDENSNDEINLSLSTFTTVGDEEDAEYSQDDEKPGWAISLSHNRVDNYKYALFTITLPIKDEFPVEVKFSSLRGDKRYMFGDIESLEGYIIDILNSKEYYDILDRLSAHAK